MNLIKDAFASRKTQGLVLLICVVMIGERAGMSAGQVSLTAEGIMAWVLGRAIVDHGLAAKSK